MANLSIVMIIIINWFEIFDSRFDKNIETFNEVIALFTIYLMMSMSDAVPHAL
jgi:hypothetical protein